MELVCPAGNFPSLRAAVDAGADAVYIGFRDETNARRFPGLNFDPETARRGVAYAHERGRRVFAAINTYAQAGRWPEWEAAVDTAAAVGVDALIVADVAVLDHARRRHPDLPLHLSVQASATNPAALRYYRERFGVRRAVLPRVLSLAQIRRVAGEGDLPLEVFGFGGLCIMAEGRCHLSSYLTGESPNRNGICSPAWAVRWSQTDDTVEARLNDVLIDRYGPGEQAGYPTLCKGRFRVPGHAGGRAFHALEEPTSLNSLACLPELHAAGVAAVKIEGRQRSPAYVARVTAVWRRAIDHLLAAPARFAVSGEWQRTLAGLSEGTQTTLGAYHRSWQ
ncbi:peptidase U32 [Salinisphaera sp. PC39]|uniref:ubiquinone anaerobic biosynthesis protein UbiU n=1 Tax=Salinisphaera sp. PC39 TaxID=1304156 RepID=UPI0033421427